MSHLSRVLRSQLSLPHRPRHIPNHVWSKIGRGLYTCPTHPLGILRRKIEDHFRNERFEYLTLHDRTPIVTVEENFDSLLIPEDHVSRLPTDTYFVGNQHVLRTQATAHQAEFLEKGRSALIWSADVYRKDRVDSLHYPVFHQCDGIRTFEPAELSVLDGVRASDKVLSHLKWCLEGLVDHLFGRECQRRWDDTATFPFTDPSLELEVFFNGKWVEVLGCGVIKQEILKNCGRQEHIGWAFGLGLERLAMILFGVDDIRVFWSDDERFWKQFSSGEIRPFRPFSRYPPVYKDVSLWKPAGFSETDFHQMCREVGDDCIENVQLVDRFRKDGRESLCFRLTYRALDRSLTHAEVNRMQEELLAFCKTELCLEIR
ncbi:unnamed protein product [Vitrella brassicaformis CCMP3155]|uniref:phenylalanine--tRNA ligase n=1 Tax=Vitrella brassicaformis (strain CCMP3155) TaxID=1169540 RepID=A0A0G4ES16_VITBC|nr:unnamed protein product [Vitrella brassicaformis CCMP3155]|mmetsp:Transcript_50855/g.127577  ORF Transcript_50855/g.127577 Transcript_50855/m.127577 type:complete len:373 (-) Transcript_50855:1580-2698(-)|eukprot:CEM00844.1 unnamed protein product [Vitrella brassicaformis CCMP3155]